ncbi:MAG: acyl-CoA dehydrogenase [Acidimicrobiia bacterium]|nr:acyl-CoA dehydrogenase [Acidimicrobiia bacterium]
MTEDQEALQGGIRSFCGVAVRPWTRRAGLRDAGGVDGGTLAEVGTSGVFGLRLAESDGGVGPGAADAVLAFEELGRALVPGPLVWTNLAAGLVDGAATGETVVGGVERHDHSGLVEHLDTIDALVVLDDDGIHRVDPSDLAGQSIDTPFDPLVPVHRVDDLLAGERIADAETVAEWRRVGATLAAAQLLGIAEGATDLAVAYASGREQFGRPVGSFQAVKHLCADMVVRNEVARAAVYAAGVTIDDPAVGPVDRAVASAKLMANEAALGNAKSCVQVHGGMGYTWEVDAHLFFKRAYALEPVFRLAPRRVRRPHGRARGRRPRRGLAAELGIGPPWSGRTSRPPVSSTS